jgi:hypothetical protein
MSSLEFDDNGADKILAEQQPQNHTTGGEPEDS